MTIVYILAAILMFGVLIALHELGHFLAAKACGVQVNEFSIGMGPALFSRTKGETQYSLRVFPIGGYCAMEGEDETSDNPRAINRQGYWKQLVIFVAGSFSNFLTGQCLEALILGSMFFVAMSLFKMPYALLVGVLVAFTALIPIFGAFIGCVVGAFLILMVDPLQALFFVIMFLVLQQIEGNLIYPKVVGNSVGLPSIWVLAAVTIGGSLMGVVGMLIFIPLVSVVYTLFRESVYKRLEQKQR